MPEITVIHIALVAISLIIGIVIGWVGRGGRSANEKTAINAGWQEQLAAQRNEHERLLEQNKSLMDQNSQYQASNKDAKMRASELSDALKETFERRDELQRQQKDIRANLDATVIERDKLRIDMQSHTSKYDSMKAALGEKDERILKLNQKLVSWQDRLPPLIERFRERNAEAESLEDELADARDRIDALDAMVGSDQTRVEPVDPDALRHGMDASNDPIDEGSAEEDVPDLIAAEELQDDPDVASDEDDIADPADEIDVEDHVADVTHEHDAEDRDFAVQNGAPADDLKLIKGVGPAIEKTLNEMGIFRFNQIAEMSEYDIDRVAHRLKGFRSRIYREDWIGQARDLYDQKVNGRL